MTKERKVQAKFRDEEIVNLRSVLRKVGDKYQAGAPIYARENDRLLLERGNFMNQKRFGKMTDEIMSSIKTHGKSPYYTTEKTEFVLD